MRDDAVILHVGQQNGCLVGSWFNDNNIDDTNNNINNNNAILIRCSNDDDSNNIDSSNYIKSIQIAIIIMIAIIKQ